MRPTVGDAAARRLVRLTHRGWCGELLFVEPPRGRAKVRLPSGTVVWVPLEQLEIVCAAAPLASEPEVAHVGGPSHTRQAG